MKLHTVSDVLTKICTAKLQHIMACKRIRPMCDIDKVAREASPVRKFSTQLEGAVKSMGYGLIAEIKKASPSKGLIRADFNPQSIAKAYALGGASCLSVLTDEPYFQGKDEFLQSARASVDLPVLRKDFILDVYQITESRALGADCILLIMAALDDGLARELAAAARDWGMDILVEIHDEEELERALLLDSDLIGVNNRNLKTLEVDIGLTERLAPYVPADRRLVSESGLYTPGDLARMAKSGAHCFLVGESLMRQDNVEAATRALLERSDMPFQA